MNTLKVTCAIINFQNRYLAVQRGPSMTLPLKWEFPGGKLEDGESEEVCILREIREELSLNIRIAEKWPSHVHDYGDFIIELIPFLAHYMDGEITLSEHRSFLLLPVEDLSKLDWAPADLPIVHHLQNQYR